MLFHTFHKKMASLQCGFACELLNGYSWKMLIHKKMFSLQCMFTCDLLSYSLEEMFIEKYLSTFENFNIEIIDKSLMTH